MSLTKQQADNKYICIEKTMSMFDLDIMISHSKKIRLQQIKAETSISGLLAMKFSSKYRRSLIDKLAMKQREEEMRTGERHGRGHTDKASDAPNLTKQSKLVPVYPRIHRKYLDIATLDHYGVPWEFDRVNVLLSLLQARALILLRTILVFSSC
jgi:hypothetical protein